MIVDYACAILLFGTTYVPSTMKGGTKVNVEEVALEYVDAINHAGANRLAALMTHNHIFVDIYSTKFSGRPGRA
jgi:hypothetical protein